MTWKFLRQGWKELILALNLLSCAQNETVSETERIKKTDSENTQGIQTGRPISVDSGGSRENAEDGNKLPPQKDDSLDHLRNSPPHMFWLLSSRSLSLKLTLKSGDKAVFKPVLKHNDRGLKEVAAFLVARHLGVNIVPPSTIKKIPLNKILRSLTKDFPDSAEELRKKSVTDSSGFVHGAVIAWVDKLDPDGIQKLGGHKAIFKLLTRAGRKANPEMASHASKMAIFDYLIGNWDRFTGGNYFPEPDGKRFVLIDHNNAFARLSEGQSRRLERVLGRVEWFPADFARRIEALQPSDITGILAKEPGNGSHPLLNDKDIERLFARKRVLISKMRELVDRYGEDGALF